MPQFFGIRLSEIETQSQHSTRRSCTFKISPQNFLDENHGNGQIESLNRGPSTSPVRRFSRLPPSRRVVNKTVALQGLNQHAAHTNGAAPGHRDQALAQRCRAGLGPKLAARLAHGPTLDHINGGNLSRHRGPAEIHDRTHSDNEMRCDLRLNCGFVTLQFPAYVSLREFRHSSADQAFLRILRGICEQDLFPQT